MIAKYDKRVFARGYEIAILETLLVVQWIGCVPPKDAIVVRFHTRGFVDKFSSSGLFPITRVHTFLLIIMV